MATIDIKDLYPDATSEEVQVPDAVAALFMEDNRREAASERRMYWHDAHYSLDCDDGIEHDALHNPLPPWAVVEDKLTKSELFDALCKLPNKQLRRVYAHYFLGKSIVEIAAAEGVHHSSVAESIQRALCNLLNLVRYPY